MTAAAGEGGTETTWSVLDGAARRAPGATALVLADDDGGEGGLTYGELHDRALDLAARFAAAGIGPGDHVALWMTNRAEWVLTSYAVARLGAVLVPVNTWLRPAEVAYVLRHAAVTHLVAIDRFRKLDTRAALAGACPGWDGTAGPVVVPDLPALRSIVVVERDAAGSPVERFGLPAAPGAALPDPPAPGDVAVILYTSGSTGRPKGVLLGHGPMVENARQHAARLEITAADTWCSPLPFFHVGGCVWGLLTAAVTGATLCTTEAFDARRTVDLLARHRATVLFGVRPIVQDVLAVLAADPVALPDVRIVSAREPAIAEEVRARFPGVAMTLNPFGMTETHGPVAMASPSSPPEEQLTSGTPLPGYEVRIADPETGAPVAPGAAGELLVRGLVTRGYWGDEQAAVGEGGWLRTGDLARVDERGNLRHVGRLKAMLKVGGENVAVEEVEGCLMSHPAVVAVAVVGRPDPRRDEVPVACVSLSAPAGPDELRAWCAERLAGFKVPVEVVVVEALPLTATAKVDREAVRRLLNS